MWHLHAYRPLKTSATEAAWWLRGCARDPDDEALSEKGTTEAVAVLRLRNLVRCSLHWPWLAARVLFP